MKMEKEQLVPGNQHVYYRMARFRSIYLIVAIAAVVVGVIMGLTARNAHSALMTVLFSIFGVVLLVIALRFAYVALFAWRKTSIILSQEGLSKYAPSSRVCTPWRNITAHVTLPAREAVRALQLQQAP